MTTSDWHDPRLHRGTEVEVRVRYQSHWAPGFEVAEVDDRRHGYLLRRRSDGHVLPAAFAREDVRPRD